MSELALQALPLGIVAIAVAVMVVRDGGFSPTVWYPTALLVLGFAAAVVLGAGQRIGHLPRALAASIACLAAFVGWSFLSTAWAAMRDSAFEGSNRDLLYLLVFGLLACWPVRSRAVWPVLLGLSLIVAIEGVVTAEQATRPENIGSFLIGSRLSNPLGYPNATAALYMASAWLMIGMASRRWIPAPARGLALGVAGLDLALNLLTESRGSVFTLPLVIVAYFVLVPGRLRSLATVGLLALGFAPVIEPVLHVYSASPGALAATLRHAIELAVVWAVLLAAAGWLFAWADGRVSVPRRMTRAATVAVWAGLLLAAAAALVVARPWQHADSAWRSFKYGGEPAGAASHFGGLGSNRYDFWRVGLVEFERHPLAGIGTDNFLVPYLQLRHSSEEPIYPHSLAVDLLSQTGLIGTGLFVGFLVLALVVVLRIPPGRERDLARVLVAAAAVLFLHGLVDWLWEMPVLGVLGMALLGTACGLGLRRPRVPRRPTPLARVAMVTAGLLATLALAACLTLPWLSDRDVQAAEQVWFRSPSTAFALLDRAQSLNPLNDQADVVAGAIASRLHRYRLMRSEFEAAVRREPDDWYARLELGIAASLTGEHALARTDLEQAVTLNPGDTIPRSVLATFERGRPIDPAAVDRAFEAEAS